MDYKEVWLNCQNVNDKDPTALIALIPQKQITRTIIYTQIYKLHSKETFAFKINFPKLLYLVYFDNQYLPNGYVYANYLNFLQLIPLVVKDNYPTNIWDKQCHPLILPNIRKNCSVCMGLQNIKKSLNCSLLNCSLALIENFWQTSFNNDICPLVDWQSHLKIATKDQSCLFEKQYTSISDILSLHGCYPNKHHHGCSCSCCSWSWNLS